MDQQPDKLFRDKLEGYDQAVPTQAWNRVSANVATRRTSVWWLSAAAVALIASAAVFIYPLKKESTGLVDKIAERRHEQSTVTRESDSVAAGPEGNAVQKESTTPSPVVMTDTADEPVRKKNAAPEQQKQHPVENGNLPIIPLPESEPVAMTEDEAILPPATEETGQQPNSSRKTVTIVFGAEEVNEKYLAKTSQHQATSDEQEASTLKNMLDKAYDLTHNQNPLGELRQKKNEILAMNFRKEKPRTQND